ncbi:hypothetical protein LOTGIDRAFT_230722 [Lottia gigantea]|uniref:Uncharacterized protein n=1 Tax=Lottia gigantea TaxID=225164 RepID=V4ABV7_LOTGI|nr:hypothetical protein LOTGIDRAFT_230722 [Lottia gigantea]ESP01464.1 hypothetical protein LOTGIDRAFT_230722 [Lottia gigantea]
MKCGANSFYNENVGSCFTCSDICDNLKGTGNSKEYCLKLCPEYKPTFSQTTEANTGSHHLEIIVPVIVLLISASIIIGVLILKHRRKRNPQYHNRRRQNLPRVDYTPAPPLTLTKEEVGDDVEGRECLGDSGIDTTRIDITLRSTEQDGYQISGSIHQETQTVLSDLCCNSKYLKNASDASGAQAL